MRQSIDLKKKRYAVLATKVIITRDIGALRVAGDSRADWSGEFGRIRSVYRQREERSGSCVALEPQAELGVWRKILAVCCQGSRWLGANDANALTTLASDLYPHEPYGRLVPESGLPDRKITTYKSEQRCCAAA